MDPISKLSFTNRRKVKKVSFDYPKEIEGVNLQEGSITKATERNARVARLSDAIIGRSATGIFFCLTVHLRAQLHSSDSQND